MKEKNPIFEMLKDKLATQYFLYFPELMEVMERWTEWNKKHYGK